MESFYIVKEFNKLESCTSTLYTSCPWLALSEWMTKVRNPLRFPQGARVGDGRLSFAISEGPVPINDDRICLTGVFSWDGDTVRKIVIGTELSSNKMENHYCAKSMKEYRERDYYHAILKMRERLQRYTKLQLDGGYILIRTACTDRLHPFWQSASLAKKRP